MQFSILNEEFLVNASHQLALITSLPFVHTALYTTVFVVPMNRAKYDSLPPDLQKVIDKNSGRELSAFLGKTQAGNDVPGKEKMIAAGHTITVIQKAELESWKKASDSIDDEWVADMNKRGLDGKGLLQDAQALIKKYTK